ncbi:MAG: DUF917 domain-containing protein [Aestuariibacter sp.]
MQITVNDLDDLILGAVFLATGGGGDPYVPQLLTRQALEKFGPVNLIAAAELADTDTVVTVGGVGAPTVSLELLPSIDECVNPLNAFVTQTNTDLTALASFEIGGANSLVPIIAAAATGLPVIDGDGMGRALPEAQMMTYAIKGVCPTPAFACDYEGNITRFSTRTTATYERHIRALAMSSGGMITTVEHPMTGKQLKDAIIPGTVSFSIQLGKVLRQHRGSAAKMLPHLQRLFGNSLYGHCELLMCGKVTDKATRIINGYDIGEATLLDFDVPDRKMKIDIKNEYLRASIDDRIVTTVPDLIVVVDHETCQPINAERLQYGQRVAVFAIGCPAFFRTELALQAVAPSCFGFDGDYVPMEELLQH